MGILNEIAEACNGKIEEVHGPLPDGSGFATMSMPLPENHWIYQGEKISDSNGENEITLSGEPPAPFRMGNGYLRDVLADVIRDAGKYAVRASTMCGKEMDFDPDAMLQNLIVGFLGYWTEDGFDHTDDS